MIGLFINPQYILKRHIKDLKGKKEKHMNNSKIF